MSTLVVEADSILAREVSVTEDGLIVELSDGRSLTVPLAWFPRLHHGTPDETRNWRLIGRGDGIHWPDLDEDISISGLLAGRPSGECARSLERWLQSRNVTV
jgi:hypothetical protein